MRSVIETRKRQDLGPLHDLLIRACPPDRSGAKSIVVLSKKLHLSNQAVYKWIHKNQIPPKQAVKIVKLAQGSVSLDDFNPYIFG